MCTTLVCKLQNMEPRVKKSISHTQHIGHQKGQKQREDRNITNMRVVPKVMSNFFLHANREQQTKESMVVDGTSCCVILECLVMSIACITWPVSLLTKWLTTICHFARVPSSNFLLKRKSLLQNSPETSACLWKFVHGCEQCSKMGETF